MGWLISTIIIVCGVFNGGLEPHMWITAALFAIAGAIGLKN